MQFHQDVTLVILAGGQGTRLGGIEKAWITWKGQPIIQRLIAKFAPQCGDLIISCNRHISRYLALGFKTCQDHSQFKHSGPLAGVLAAAPLIKTGLLLLLPCDCPAPPANLLSKLYTSLNESEANIAYAHDGERDQYLFSLIETEALASLQPYLETGSRSVKGWLALNNALAVDFSDESDGFKNINTPKDLEKHSTLPP